MNHARKMVLMPIQTEMSQSGGGLEDAQKPIEEPSKSQSHKPRISSKPEHSSAKQIF